MSLSPVEQNAFAYYAATGANDLNIASRWYPYGELIMILEDKVQVAVRKFGIRAKGGARAAATAFVDHMIEKGGWSSKQNEFGGTMHQFQGDAYRTALKDIQANDPIIAASEGKGPDYWTDSFAAATKA